MQSKGLVLVCLLAGGCVAEDDGAFWGPESAWPWPWPRACGSTFDGGRDGTVDSTMSYDLDLAGQVVGAYFAGADGDIYRRLHREYAGPRLSSEVSRNLDGVGYRSIYVWDGDRVTSRMTTTDRGTTGVTRWEYDELGRNTRILQDRTSYRYEHLDDDTCPDVTTYSVEEVPVFVAINMNRPDCQLAGYDFDQDADGTADVLWRNEFDAEGHPLRSRRRDNLDGASVPRGEWRYTWDGDLKLSEEAIDVGGPDGLNQRTDYDYDCAERHDVPRR